MAAPSAAIFTASRSLCLLLLLQLRLKLRLVFDSEFRYWSDCPCSTTSLYAT